MDIPGRQHESIHDEEQRPHELAHTRHGISHAYASATEQLELLSIADFNDFSRESNVESLHRAVLHGVSAVGTTPSDHPQHAAGLKRLQVRIFSSFELLHPHTAISLAASWGLTGILQRSLEMGVGVDLRADSDRTPLHLATKNGHEAVIRMLLRGGADINAKDIDGRTALHFAAEQGHAAIVRLLGGNGADVHAKMNSMFEGVCCGATALHCAAWQGHEVMVRTLLDIGAEVDEEDRWDARTALHMAALKGHEAVARLLLRSGAAVDGSLNNDRGTPLIDAAASGHEAVVRLLLSNGANVEATDSDGDPALHSAAFAGREAVVRLLLDHGADPAARGGSGRMARWFATEKGHQAVARLLLERGGDDKDAPDMQNDAYECLGNVAEGRLLEHIERAQQIMFHESEIQHWVQNLRFVVPAVNADDSDFVLELVESSARDEDTKDEPYVAVSYCWARNASKEGTPLRIQVPSKNQRGAKETRDARAPSNILRRSLEFAAVRGIKKVWIDQECIHQDDEEDRRMAIQCMHLVYRRAAITLIVLGDHVRTLEDVRAIPYIKQHGVHEELRDRILGDRWFSRAWTTQEYANSARERLSYLVGWKDGMDISGDIWQLEATAFNARREHARQNVRRAWELDHGTIFDISCMSMRHTQVMLSMSANLQFAGSAPNQRTFRLLDQDIEAKDWWKGEGSRQRGEMGGVSGSPAAYQKLRMTMPGAYVTLRQKECLLNSDRLAMLSNLAYYPNRIKTDHVVSEALSFTACVIAIALYNGDLSPLFCQNFDSSNINTEIPTTHLASWLPFGMCSIDSLFTIRGMPTHSYFAAHMPTGDRCLVLDGKAIIKGLLWDIVPFHEFAILRDSIRELQQSGKKGAGQLLLRELVDLCFKLGRRDILELIITTALPRQLIYPAEIFDLMDELDASFHRNCSRPADIAEESNLQSVQTVTAWPWATGAKDSLPAAPSENDLMKWICYAISNGLPLALGKCNIGEGEEEETLISIFTFDPAEHRIVFTPLSELEYEFGESAWVHLEPKSSFWCVSACEAKVADATMQRARRELNVEEDGLYISNQILKIERSSGTLHRMQAIWSPRLSRAGMHTRDSETKSWGRVPLGRGREYRRQVRLKGIDYVENGGQYLTCYKNEKEWVVKMVQKRIDLKDPTIKIRSQFMISASGLLDCLNFWTSRKSRISKDTAFIHPAGIKVTQGVPQPTRLSTT